MFYLITNDTFFNPYYISSQELTKWRWHSYIDRDNQLRMIKDKTYFKGKFVESIIYKHNCKLVNKYPTFEELIGSYIELII